MKAWQILVLFLFNISVYGNQITIIGCGYVGLALASILSRNGHTIVCVDIDKEKITSLNNYTLPFYEPNLDDTLFNAARKGTIIFVDDVERVLESEIFYLCVATPTDATGKCDCSLLNSCFNTIISKVDAASKIICIKSTVPPGTMQRLQALIKEKKHSIHLVYNPEFLREGSALQDIMNNPIVIGGESTQAIEKIADLYSNFQTYRIIKTNFETAEILKYAWNSFSAMRITYINELAVLCRKFNADIATVTQGLALSECLLPTAAIKPGPGYGGSCLPKDAAAFAKVMEEQGFSSSIIHQVITSNNNHRKRLISDVCALLGKSEYQKVVTILGLAFKAHTNDIRNSPAIDLIKALIERGIIVKVYDPQAMNSMKELFAHIHYCNSPYQAVQGADCIVVLTDWDEFKEIDFDKIAVLCNKKIIVDTKNIYNPELLKKYNFTLYNYGKH